MQYNVINPGSLVATVAANFGALEALTIFHTPAGFLVVSGKDANPDPAKGEKVVFSGYGAEFSEYRMGKVLEQIGIKKPRKADIPIHFAKTKATVLKAKTLTLQQEIILLLREYEAANESAEPLKVLEASLRSAAETAAHLETAISILWD